MGSEKNTIEEVKTDIKQTACELSRRVGKNPLVPELYFTLFFSKEPLSIKEIHNATGYSIATVSQTMELAVQFLDVRRFKKPGSKKLYFQCEHDTEKFMAPSTQMFKLVQKSMAEMMDTLSKSEEKLKSQKGEDAKFHLENIQKLYKKYEEHNQMFIKFFEIMLSK
ncbi:MAG: hypothetical protein ABH950_06020 [Candidatus Altiarchaeota archaeon]